MSKRSELRGVAHNIAHHAGSGLSYISPHLANSLRAAGSESTEIELLVSHPYPENAVENQPLKLALATLAKFAVTLLAKHGYNESEVASITLCAIPRKSDEDGYFLQTKVAISTVNGKVCESGWLG
jgi:hypothetical protein